MEITARDRAIVRICNKHGYPSVKSGVSFNLRGEALSAIIRFEKSCPSGMMGLTADDREIYDLCRMILLRPEDFMSLASAVWKKYS